MAYYPDIGFGKAQEAGNGGAGLLVVERHDHYRALALLQILHTMRKPVMIRLWHCWRR